MDKIPKNSNEIFHHSRWKIEWDFTSFNLLGTEFFVKIKCIKFILSNYNKQLSKVSQDESLSFSRSKCD